MQELECRLGGTEGEQAVDFLEQARRGRLGDFLVVLVDGVICIGFDVKAQSGGEADGAQHSYGVLSEPYVGVANAADHAMLEVVKSADVIDNLEGTDIVEESVDGEVPSAGILLRRTECVVMMLEEGGLFGGFTVGLVGVRGSPESACLDDLFAEPDVSEAKAATDQKAVSEELPDLVGVSVGSDIEVLGGPAEQQVANAAADEVRDEARLVKPVEHSERVGINVPTGNAMRGALQDNRLMRVLIHTFYALVYTGWRRIQKVFSMALIEALVWRRCSMMVARLPGGDTHARLSASDVAPHEILALAGVTKPRIRVAD